MVKYLTHKQRLLQLAERFVDVRELRKVSYN